MKKNCGLLVAGILLASTLASFAAKREDVDFSVWRINGTRVTATAAQLNTAGTVAAYPLVTNTTVALARQLVASVTNATVGGGVLSGVGTVVTNATVGGGVLSGVGTVVTNATVAGAALSGVGVVVTNVATATTIIAATNGTISVTLTVGSVDWGGTNVVTNVVVNTATFTPQTASAVATLTVESGTPVVSTPSITLTHATPAVSAPTITLTHATPAVSTPTITLQSAAVNALTNAVLTLQRIP